MLNDEHTKFRVKLKEGVYWSDGVEFTVDDMIYTLDTYFAGKGKLTYFGVTTSRTTSRRTTKIDDYTFEVETANPAYDFETVMGVYTWGSALNIVPKHIFEQLERRRHVHQHQAGDLGPYTIKEFDPNGFWQLWELREDWQRSAWGSLTASPSPNTCSTRTSAPRKRARWRSCRTSTTSTPS